MPFDYPVFLDVEDIEVLVVGGGPVAFRKASALAEAGAHVTVVAPELTAEFGDGPGPFHRIERRRYRTGEAADYQLVMAATDDPDTNAQVAEDTRASHIWVNSADDPDNCSFILPAIARRGPVTIAVSTGGASPSLAARLRDVVAEQVLTARVETAATELARQRAEIRLAGGSTEDVDWTDRVDAALDSP